jgi:hypothetical protein
MTNDNAVAAEDILPVRSRISWGAIAAGSVLALAMYFLLTLLGGAIGLSVTGNVTNQALGIGAAIWAILTTAGVLFLGGFIASQFTTGENKAEAVMYGLLVWAVVFASLLWLMASGVQAGFNAMVGMANPAATANANANVNWEEAARRNGATEAEIERVRNAPDAIRNAINNPTNQAIAAENATRAAWFSFLGTLLSMAAAGFGGLLGSGPTLRLFTVRTVTPAYERRSTMVHTS